MGIRHRVLEMLGEREFTVQDIAKAIRASVEAVIISVQHLERDGLVQTRWDPETPPALIAGYTDPRIDRPRLVRITLAGELARHGFVNPVNTPTAPHVRKDSA